MRPLFGVGGVMRAVGGARLDPAQKSLSTDGDRAGYGRGACRQPKDAPTIHRPGQHHLWRGDEAETLEIGPVAHQQHPADLPGQVDGPRPESARAPGELS